MIQSWWKSRNNLDDDRDVLISLWFECFHPWYHSQSRISPSSYCLYNVWLAGHVIHHMSLRIDSWCIHIPISYAKSETKKRLKEQETTYRNYVRTCLHMIDVLTDNLSITCISNGRDRHAQPSLLWQVSVYGRLPLERRFSEVADNVKMKDERV